MPGIFGPQTQRKSTSGNNSNTAGAVSAATGRDSSSQGPSSISPIAPVNPNQVDSGGQVEVTADNFDTTFRPAAQQTAKDQIAKNSAVQKNYNLDKGTQYKYNFNKPKDASFDSRVEALGLNFTPQPNPLNIYASYDYRIRFFMTTTETAYNFANNNQTSSDNMVKTVIAESGVTAGFNVVSLRMEAAAGADRHKRNLWFATEYTMVISEPLNLSLMDKIYYAAKELAIDNYMRCPYFIEISFTGYDEDGIIVSNKEWLSLHRVIILDVSANATQVGTTYTLKLADDGAMGEMNQYSTPPTNLTVPATNMGEFYDKLAQKWNAAQAKVNQDNLIRTEYVIRYPDIFKTWNLKNNETPKQNSRNTSMDAKMNGNEMVITISRGNSIENIVNFVSYLSQDLEKWIAGEGSVSPGGANLKENGMIRYISVFPKHEIIGWDPSIRDYIRRITYFLIPTETIRAYTDMNSVKQLQAPTVTVNKLKYMVQQNRLVKRYDYIYTGRNTEVIRFDINIDNYWAIVQPTWDQINSYDQHTQGPIADTNSKAWQQDKNNYSKQTLLIQKRIAEIDSVLATNQGMLPSDRRQALVEEKGSLTNKIQQINQRQAGPGSANPAPSTAPVTSSDTPRGVGSGSQVLFSNKSPGAVVLSNQGIKDPLVQQYVQKRMQLLTGRQGQMATKYIEQYDNDYMMKNNDDPLPVTGMFDTKPYQQNARQSADQNKVPAGSKDPMSYGPGTGLVGAIFGNLYDPNYFLEIDLEIRGDPWWIPIGNIQQEQIARQSLGNPTNRPPGQIMQANYIGGDNAILLEMRVGVEIDEETGLRKVQGGSDFIDGIYTILNVTNDFNQGRFTQTLHCAKDVLQQSMPLVSGKPQATSIKPNATAPVAITPGPVSSPDGAFYGVGYLSG